MLLLQIVTSLGGGGGTLYPIKKQTKSTRILKIIIIRLNHNSNGNNNNNNDDYDDDNDTYDNNAFTCHSCPIHPLVTQGVLQKLNLI